MNKLCLLFVFIVCASFTYGQSFNESVVGKGWSGNSINTTIFRKNSIASDRKYQYVSYYDGEGFVVIAKRIKKGNKWTIFKTDFKGNIKDAHNSISIAIDGHGFVHLAWDQHNNKLNYARSKEVGAIDKMSRVDMIGTLENSVTYPEFYVKSNGNLLFLYRDGGSGRGNLVLNAYDATTKVWSRIQDNLIDGEGVRNAYPQFCIDIYDNLYVSWVWRNTPDVATNHNLCFAMSTDAGFTWKKSTGENYKMPIKYDVSEIVCRIPERSDLMNQTSMAVDRFGHVFIANYWRDAETRVPQYHIVSFVDRKWEVTAIPFRTSDFSLSGGGTKSIPISRPQVILDDTSKKVRLYVLFRDSHMESRPYAAKIQNIRMLSKYELLPLSKTPVGAWEPSYDVREWLSHKKLSIYLQDVTQVDGEGLAKVTPTDVRVLDVKL